MIGAEFEMTKRSFRAFATKEDLQSVFLELQNTTAICYCPTYADFMETIKDITKIGSFGANRHGSHIGNHQYQVFHATVKPMWNQYHYRTNGQVKTRYTSLTQDNKSVMIDLGGIYDETTLFPTTVATISYEIAPVKELYTLIGKIFRRHAAKRINGFFICTDAYAKKAEYRFCMIDIKSPREYDLIVE